MRVSNTGDEYVRSLKEIYESYFEDLYSYARAITNSSDLAKDAVSEVFFDLIKTQRDLTYIRDIKSYLFKSVKNGCIKLVSRDPIQFEALFEESEYQLIEEINPEEIIMGKELEDFLHHAIEALPPQSQLTFKLVRIENLSYEEAANELGISTNTVRNHLVAATKSLRESLVNQYSNESIMRVVSKLGAVILGFSWFCNFI